MSTDVVGEDRRSEEDRRSSNLGPPGGLPERRQRGRPALPEEQRQRTLHVKVPPELHDALCRVSVRTDVAINALIRKLLERTFLPKRALK